MAAKKKKAKKSTKSRKAKGEIPLAILKRRQQRLTKIILERTS